MRRRSRAAPAPADARIAKPGPGTKAGGVPADSAGGVDVVVDAFTGGVLVECAVGVVLGVAFTGGVDVVVVFTTGVVDTVMTGVVLVGVGGVGGRPRDPCCCVSFWSSLRRKFALKATL